ncbi:MAG: hypothetical protein H7Z75_22010 [Ferruginibacter sp.]|nr:hypothetical protein [Cytophagales bacterium]
MKKFSIERLSFGTLSELPNSWQNQDYRELFRKMNYDNPDELKDSELKEMCLMSFTDVEPDEAAQIVLAYLFREALTEGQIENLAPQMMTEKLWEEYPELSLHEGFFKATQLLYAAYNGKFPRTEAVRFRIRLTAEDGGDLAIFDAHPEAPLVRLLAQGMSGSALINRLFSHQLEGARFDEAKHILWQLDTIEKEKDHVVFEVTSSSYWLDDFKYADSYQATTHEDSASTPEN